MSMCLGADATFVAMQKHPEEFEHVLSMIAVQPISSRPLVEKLFENLGIENGVELFDEAYRKLMDFRVDDTDMTEYAKSIKIP
ncbi:alpha/beta hydrolase, partial [bacterium]|nr:alpha/beta hydrolase [bacterium]